MEMPCFDGAGRSDSDEGRGFRRRKFSSDPLCCPVCGVTVRHGELQTHFARELDCLLKLSSSNRGRRQSLDAFRALNNSMALQSQKIQINVSPEDRWNTFQKIKTNRQGRLHTKSRRHKGNESICPVCTNNVQGSIEDLKSHVEMCLRKQNGEPCDDEFVDVEGDSEMFEEYEWAGQQRVRASTLLEGGFAATGMATCSSHSNAPEEDVDIVVDGDDCATYGPAQYSERDIVLITNDETREVLIEAVTGTDSGNTSLNNGNASQESSEDFVPNETSLISGSTLCLSDAPSGTLVNPVVDVLKARVRELETKVTSDKKCACRICLEPYDKPVISVSCWHVHCQDCWLRVLGAKKLCPQCNMITSSSDLRRIYL